MAKTQKNYYQSWADISERIAGQHEEGAYALITMTNSFKAQEAGKHAFREFLLECFSDELIERKSTGWRDFDKASAIEHELMQRHHWLPSYIRDMSDEELMTVFHEDLQKLTLPVQAYDACREDLKYCRLHSLLENHV